MKRVLLIIIASIAGSLPANASYHWKTPCSQLDSGWETKACVKHEQEHAEEKGD